MSRRKSKNFREVTGWEKLFEQQDSENPAVNESAPEEIKKPERKAQNKLPELSIKSAVGSDKKTFRKLKSGEFKIEARLDLHGFRLGEAQQALTRFIEKSYEAEKKCVLVITGKGRHSQNNSATINSEFSDWINREPLRAKIISVSSAAAKDGGSGAFYV